MIKLESVVKTNKISQDNSITFQLKNDKINYIFSKSKENIIDFFSIMSGFYHPALGYIVYDDINLTDLSFKEKAKFMQEKMSILTPFNIADANKTIFSIVKRNLIFNNKNLNNINQVVIEWLKHFKFNYLRNEKIKNLSNEQLIKLHILLIKIKNPKYVLISDFEKYLFSKDYFNYFFDLLKKNITKDCYIMFFSNQIYNDSNFSLINIDDLSKNVDENWMLIRNNKFLPKNNSNFTFKYFFLSLNEILKSNYIYSFLFFILNTFLLSIFSISNINYNSNFLNANFLKSIRLVLIFSLFIINSIYIFFLYNHNSYLIFLMTRSGQNLFLVIFLYCFYYLVSFIFGWLISLIYPLLNSSSSILTIDWAILIIICVSIIAISLFVFVLIFAFVNKNIIKKNNDFI